jgi:hypothetical protein
MELLETVEKGLGAAQNPRRQEMALGVKGAALEALVLAFAHDPLHVFLRDLQVA